MKNETIFKKNETAVLRKIFKVMKANTSVLDYSHVRVPKKPIRDNADFLEVINSIQNAKKIPDMLIFKGDASLQDMTVLTFHQLGPRS